ncbi:vitamin B12 dependent-methionine synthase activation domain-containing protein [Clostridium lundense]|uniref:vitamin B12 dependent-methionine synthase activation domain-containing protein n=1 Tax=Clostridium lundense TaxID=319475 RepID=UPI000488760D|nr:vitamin B12 dependent-methionine synthase activation domain-containing protein [Clostridium lundense]
MHQCNLKISREEVLRYLGVKSSLEENVNNLIDETIEEIKKIIRLNFTWKVFLLQVRENKIILQNCKLELCGKSINNHLKYCDKCVLFAATLGSEVDRKINYYEKSNMTKALIFDACATAAIEEACDFVEEEIRKTALKDDKEITWRFSPGYGDLRLDIQKEFLQLLDAYKKLGLTVSSHSILIPRKSVTAIIGFMPKDKKIEKKSCINCNKYDSCGFRKIGGICEY